MDLLSLKARLLELENIIKNHQGAVTQVMADLHAFIGAKNEVERMVFDIENARCENQDVENVLVV